MFYNMPVVPPKKREQIIAEPHDTHPGITLMKAGDMSRFDPN